MKCIVSLCKTATDADDARNHWGQQGWTEAPSVAGQTFDVITAECWTNSTQSSPVAGIAPGLVLLFTK